MCTVAIFKNSNNRAIRLPKDMDFDGIAELEIFRIEDSIILKPIKPTWDSFLSQEKADNNFLGPDIIEEGRVKL
ncbi:MULTISPECIES: type II toxin-antitoxin system VapB family antitoxin [Photorhabdus]|uniref:SpoVT-AbrB domain-containing protein n=1 Tax=Photorhabdus thracensis TaxID=230089 RepID=A0A0F7LTE2_9GAMM|nr:type II toxin-antitoxin system VapB family antitoxin [Photorhabdus thracensis]AKH65158.1 hypothetical protein VY86_19180 [Photorhabdus thracensis]MCC8421253.1 AbrB/MazE/SpoVT family DNA-binding domain-containing protein [Photorhabdus thracensis]